MASIRAAGSWLSAPSFRRSMPVAHSLSRSPSPRLSRCLLPPRRPHCSASLLTSSGAKALPGVILSVATVTSGFFAGIAAAITLIEHPAKLTALDIPNGVLVWRDSYERAFVVQGALAGFTAFASAIGSVISAANNFPAGLTQALGLSSAAFFFIWAFTIVILLPVNKDLYKEHTEDQYKDLLVKWGNLHLVRSLVGTVAFLVLVYTGYNGIS